MLYRVDAYRRLLPNRGMTGGGLMQFYGIKSSRTREVTKGAKWSAWSDPSQPKEHTVEVTRDLQVKK